MYRRTTFFALPLAGLLALGAACGDGPDETDSASTPTAAAEGTAIVLENPTTTASGLQYVDEVVGTGATPSMQDSVTVHYTGRLASNGEVFDSSIGGQPATFAMTRVIAGFAEAISTMKVGGKRTALLPSELAYGPGGFAPDIPPNADLVFEIELIAIQ